MGWLAVVQQGQLIEFQVVDGETVCIGRVEREADFVDRDGETVGPRAGRTACLRVRSPRLDQERKHDQAADDWLTHGAVCFPVYRRRAWARLGLLECMAMRHSRCFAIATFFRPAFRPPMLVLLLCAAPYFVHAQAGSEPAPAVPDWAQPGSPTHVQVPPPRRFSPAKQEFRYADRCV